MKFPSTKPAEEEVVAGYQDTQDILQRGGIWRQ